MEPELAEAFDEGISELVAASGGRIEALACGECRPGFVGACVSSYRLMGDMEELAHALRKRGQLLFVHPGLPAPVPVGAPPWWTAVVDYTTQMQAARRAIRSYPLCSDCLPAARLSSSSAWQRAAATQSWPRARTSTSNRLRTALGP
jgi:hypothetical protein